MCPVPYCFSPKIIIEIGRVLLLFRKNLLYCGMNLFYVEAHFPLAQMAAHYAVCRGR